MGRHPRREAHGNMVQLGRWIGGSVDHQIMEAVHQLDPGQQGAIAQLLKSVIGSGLPASLVSAEFLHWKFFSPRADFPGSRSYALTDAGRIEAHACEWPVSFACPPGDVKSCHLI